MEYIKNSKEELGSEMVTQQVQFLGVNFKLEMPKEVYEFFEKDYQNYLPKMHRMESAEVNNGVQVTISYGQPKLSINGSSAFLSNTAGVQRMTRDAELLVSKLLERELNNMGIFSLHASGVAYNGKGVLILGPSGAGKSTTAIAACLQDNKAKFISGNRVFMMGDNAIGGSATTRLRVGSIIMELGMNGNGAISNPKMYDSKVSLNPEEIGVSLNEVYPVKIETLVIVKKLDKTFSVDKNLDISNDNKKNDAFLLFWESATEFSETFPNLALGPKIPYPDIFNQELREKRVQFVSDLIKNVRVAKAEGRLSDLSNFVLELLRE